jgi:hypothetical protein
MNHRNGGSSSDANLLKAAPTAKQLSGFQPGRSREAQALFLTPGKAAA